MLSISFFAGAQLRHHQPSAEGTREKRRAPRQRTGGRAMAGKLDRAEAGQDEVPMDQRVQGEAARRGCARDL